MLDGVLGFLADHWLLFALGYVACIAFALALGRAAKLADEAWERARRQRGRLHGAGEAPDRVQGVSTPSRDGVAPVSNQRAAGSSER